MRGGVDTDPLMMLQAKLDFVKKTISYPEASPSHSKRHMTKSRQLLYVIL